MTASETQEIYTRLDALERFCERLQDKILDLQKTHILHYHGSALGDTTVPIIVFTRRPEMK